MDYELTWRKSSYSGAVQNCVELAVTAGAAHVRHSKHPTEGHLSFPMAEVAAFVAGAKAGELDNLL
jgi:hypothetical protein